MVTAVKEEISHNTSKTARLWRSDNHSTMTFGNDLKQMFLLQHFKSYLTKMCATFLLCISRFFTRLHTTCVQLLQYVLPGLDARVSVSCPDGTVCTQLRHIPHLALECVSNATE